MRSLVIVVGHKGRNERLAREPAPHPQGGKPELGLRRVRGHVHTHLGRPTYRQIRMHACTHSQASSSLSMQILSINIMHRRPSACPDASHVTARRVSWSRIGKHDNTHLAARRCLLLAVLAYGEIKHCAHHDRLLAPLFHLKPQWETVLAHV
jgi:hypothetical protein